jgi:hypothetical protein
LTETAPQPGIPLPRLPREALARAFMIPWT